MQTKKLLALMLTLVMSVFFIVPLAVSAELVPAAFQSAAATGKNTIVLTMDKALTDGSHASANGFTVGGTLANGPVDVTNVVVLDTAVTLSLDKDLVYGDTIELSYDSSLATVKLVGADGEVASFSGNSVTNTLPQTITLLNIADAIAPINGGTPATLIAETDQYTGTVNWGGAPASFNSSTSYTATITLTAKPGYTFEGVAQNAFTVPCAASATNAANSGVITALFVSPPTGYITDGNGVMAYRFIPKEELYSNYGTFDIMGFFYNGWKQTTYDYYGFRTLYRDDDVFDVLNVDGTPVTVGDTGLTMDVDIDFVSGGRALQIKYNVTNPNVTDVEDFDFGTVADVQIGSDDTARITLHETDKPATENRGFTMVSDDISDRKTTGDGGYEFAQLNFFGKYSVGVTNVDTFWFGHCGSATANLFNQVLETTYSDDSGMAYSWQNRTIGAGDTQVYSVVLGIGGVESADVLGYSISYSGNVTDETITVPETQQKQINVTLPLSTQIPVRDGYSFVSWNTQTDGYGTAYQPGDNYTLNESTILYAQWVADSYTITYKDMGTDVAFSGIHGTNVPTAHTYGTATALVSPTKAGYTFDGWFTDSACSGAAVTSLGATDYTANITLYARWTAISATAPTIDSVNGATLTYGYTEGLVSVTATPADGHTITGYQWYSNPTNSNNGGEPVLGATSASYTIPAGINAGTYYYYCVVISERTDNNQTASVTSGVAELTVQKAKVTRPTANATTFTYNGQDQTYNPTDFDSNLMNISNNVQTDVGSYEVSVSLKDTVNYEWATSGDAAIAFTFMIEKATPSYTVPEGLTATYGDTLSSVTLPTGWAWDDSTVSVGNATTNTFKATYTPTDTNNYIVVSNVDIDVTVVKAQQITVPNVQALNETVANSNDGKITGITDKMEYKVFGADDSTYTAITGTEITLAAGKYSIRYAGDSNHNPSEAVTVEIKAYINTDTDNSTTSETGDTRNIWLWTILLLVSAAGLAGFYYDRKRRITNN